MKSALFKTLNRITVTYIPRLLTNGLAILVLAMIVLISLQIFARSIFTSPINGLEELVRYLFVWSIFIGAGLAAAENRHLSAGVSFMRHLPESFRVALTILIWGGVFLTMLAFVGHGVTLVQLNDENLSPALRLPMKFVWSCVPIGGILLTYYLGVYMLEKIVAEREGLRPESMNQDSESR